MPSGGAAGNRLVFRGIETEGVETTARPGQTGSFDFSVPLNLAPGGSIDITITFDLVPGEPPPPEPPPPSDPKITVYYPPCEESSAAQQVRKL